LFQGNLLVAKPLFFNDKNFSRSVILLANHQNSGSLGFILNKPINIYLNKIIPIINQKFNIYFGGPVERDNLFFIHNSANLIPNSIKIDKNLFWGGDFDCTIKLINSKKICSKHIRFFLGYSGWSKNQLKNELNSNSWIIKENIYQENIIALDYNTIWRDQIRSMGGDYLMWSNAPENPNLN
jgi:putative transcriptional regulator